MNCIICQIELPENSKAKTCSPKCRKILSRSHVTDGMNVTPRVTVTDVTFTFYVPQKPEVIREAKYWYDVPISAIPVTQQGWPACPDYMNGRQYFLWWKNEFKVTNSGPVILGI